MQENPAETTFFACDGNAICYCRWNSYRKSERSSVVERHLAKVAVVGSSPIARSIFLLSEMQRGVSCFRAGLIMTPSSPDFGFCAALTGGIACGKSTVSEWFAQKGVETVDADVLAHHLTAPGGAAMPAILEHFGPDFLDVAGGMDRVKMADLVFTNPIARRKLEDILHPPIQALIMDWAAEIHATRRLGLAAIPLLFECNMASAHAPWDAIFCVAADSSVVLARLLTRGHSQADAQQRLAAQWPVQEKAALATETIWNNGTREELHARCEEIWNTYFLKGKPS